MADLERSLPGAVVPVGSLVVPGGAQGPPGPPGTGGSGAGGVEQVNTGTGLIGGPITTVGTVALTIPVSIANGGTNAVTAGAALTNLGAAPLANAPAPGAAGSVLASNGTVAAYTRDLANLNSVVVNQNAAATLPAPLAGTLLQLGAADAQNTRLLVDAFAIAPNLIVRRANGSPGTMLTALLSGNSLGGLAAWGYDGSNYTNTASATFNTTENWSTTARGSNFIVSTTPNGTSVSAINLTLDGAGNLTILGATATKPGGGSWTAPSDARLKRAIAPYQSGLAEIARLEPISFEYNGLAGTPLGGQFYGLDADHTRVIMPELVGEGSWRPPPDEADQDSPSLPIDFATIDSGPLIFALCNAVRELAGRIERLEATAGRPTR